LKEEKMDINQIVCDPCKKVLVDAGVAKEAFFRTEVEYWTSEGNRVDVKRMHFCRDCYQEATRDQISPQFMPKADKRKVG